MKLVMTVGSKKVATHTGMMPHAPANAIASSVQDIAATMAKHGASEATLLLNSGLRCGQVIVTLQRNTVNFSGYCSLRKTCSGGA